MTTTIYPARRVITMNPAFPFAEAVAVRDGRVLGVGTVEELAGWGEHSVDNTFADKVLTPGFIEAHTHVMSGGVWQFRMSVSSIARTRMASCGQGVRASMRSSIVWLSTRAISDASSP